MGNKVKAESRNRKAGMGSWSLVFSFWFILFGWDLFFVI
jgi:hypothetical protein